MLEQLEQYSELVESVYQLSQNKHVWSEPLSQLKNTFNANYVTLILKPPFDEEDEIGLMIALGENIPGNEHIQYLPYRRHITPFVDQQPDKVFTVDDLMREEEWQQSSYRKHWCETIDVYHVMAVDLQTEDGDEIRMRLTRSQNSPAFSLEDKEQCQSLVPHLKRALSLHLQLNHSQTLGAAYNNVISRLSIATIEVDESGRILDKNPYAEEMLNQGDGIKVVAGKLSAHYSNDSRELKQLIQTSFKNARLGEKTIFPESMSISRPSGEVNFGVVVEVMSDWDRNHGASRALIYIRDSVAKCQASSHVAKKIFGLTTAETALTLQLADGLSLEEAAEELNIKRNTARAHLRSIFSKTGVRRQTELVRILLNSVASLGRPETELTH